MLLQIHFEFNNTQVKNVFLSPSYPEEKGNICSDSVNMMTVSITDTNGTLSLKSRLICIVLIIGSC